MKITKCITQVGVCLYYREQLYYVTEPLDKEVLQIYINPKRCESDIPLEHIGYDLYTTFPNVLCHD